MASKQWKKVFLYDEVALPLPEHMYMLRSVRDGEVRLKPRLVDKPLGMRGDMDISLELPHEVMMRLPFVKSVEVVVKYADKVQIPLEEE